MRITFVSPPGVKTKTVPLLLAPTSTEAFVAIDKLWMGWFCPSVVTTSWNLLAVRSHTLETHDRHILSAQTRG